MNRESKLNRIDVRYLFRAVIAWSVSALFLLLIGSAIIASAGVGASQVAYFSSAISFLSAFFAGGFAAYESGSFRWPLALLCGVILSVLLLLIGFLIAGNDLAADGIISVVTFTVAGALVGNLFAPKRTGRRKGSLSLRKKK